MEREVSARGLHSEDAAARGDVKAGPQTEARTGSQTGTPARIEFLKNYLGSEIYIKRDDLIPFSYGGNKVRIAEELLKDLREKGCTALISYGSETSNMNRAAADLAAREGLKCYVVMKREDPYDGPAHTLLDREPENKRLVTLSGAEVLPCTASEVRERVEEAFARAEAAGEKPYYIFGDSTGHGNELTLMRASRLEYAEIADYTAETGIRFDYLVLTVGTCMTISGLAAAMAETASDTKLVGFSSAREAGKIRQLILGNLKLQMPERGEEELAKLLPEIRDEYLCGGYGCFTDEVEETILSTWKSYGVPLDPVYTGKSFYGLQQEIEKGRIRGRVLFIHTGGYPLWQDFAKSRKAELY